MMVDVEATGRNIHDLMLKNNITARQISDAMGLAKAQQVYRWINGKMLPKIDNLLILSEMFGVPVEKIVITRKAE